MSRFVVETEPDPTPMQGVTERRGQRRFPVQDGGIALMTPQGPYSTVVGEILDVSSGGLSFRYLAESSFPNGPSKVTLAFPESKFYLRELPIETVSDHEIAKMPFGSLSPRRRGLRFGELSRGQKSHLDHLIKCYTVTNA